MAYKACLALIRSGRTTGLKDKIDLFLAFERITADQYTELISMIPSAEE